MARRYAAGLAFLGAGTGDRVVLRLPNGPDALALPAAIWAVGAVPVLVPLDIRPEGFADICARTEPRVILTDPVDLGDEDPFDGAAEAGFGSIVFTSGSTGRPKGVVQRQETLLDGAARVAEAVGFGADDRVLSAVPWSHDYGWTQVLAAYVLGVTLVLPAQPGLAGLPEAIERHRPTVLGGVPSVYAGLTRGVSDIATRDRSSLRLIMSTGSLMPQRVWDDLAALFPGARRVLNYGLTETFRSATLRPEDEALAPLVVGSALPGSGLCVVDAAGAVLPARAWGEVVHRGAGVFDHYWDDAEQTALRRRPDPVTGQGFAVFTGDLGMLDEAGRLTLGDRIDRMVKVMGLAASPLVIEQVLRGVEGVEAAAVVSRPHEILGAELHAFVVGGEVKAAEAACRAGLAAHERPRKVHKLDAMPLTASGKVDLVALRQQIAG
jgi:acyl-CoA synthetase (AMP-forming)/AMP-acid ligase II